MMCAFVDFRMEKRGKGGPKRGGQRKGDPRKERRIEEEP